MRFIIPRHLEHKKWARKCKVWSWKSIWCFPHLIHMHRAPHQWKVASIVTKSSFFFLMSIEMKFGILKDFHLTTYSSCWKKNKKLLFTSCTSSLARLSYNDFLHLKFSSSHFFTKKKYEKITTSLVNNEPRWFGYNSSQN